MPGGGSSNGINPPTRRASWLFFLAVTLIYLSLSPGRIAGMGYTGHNLRASAQILSRLGDALAGRPAMAPIDWPKHGALELVFELPFLAAGRLFLGDSAESDDRALSVQPILATALLCMLILLWVRALTGSMLWSYVVASAAAFGTMLWPYAYMGLETTPSLFLLLAAYLALRPGSGRGWPTTLTFALSAGLAVSLKSSGVFLAPAVAFLLYASGRARSPATTSSRAAIAKAMVAPAIVGLVFFLGAYTRSFYWSKRGQAFLTFVTDDWLADGPLTSVANAWALYFSVNKGLLVYAPVAFLGLAVCGRAFRADSRLVTFVVLVLAGITIAMALFIVSSDESWGPRYLHAAVGPLVVCLGAAKGSVPFRLRREAPLLGLSALGLAVSLLGSLFYYGALHQAATRVSLVRLEAFSEDLCFNHPRFNLALLRLWLRARVGFEVRPLLWPPARHWRPSPLPPSASARRVDLREFAHPQPAVLRDLETVPANPGRDRLGWRFYGLCLALGLALWIASGRLALERQPTDT